MRQRMRIIPHMDDTIYRIRDKLGLTQTAFAAALGVTQATVSRWETGALPVRPRDLLAARQLLAERTGAAA